MTLVLSHQYIHIYYILYIYIYIYILLIYYLYIIWLLLVRIQIFIHINMSHSYLFFLHMAPNTKSNKYNCFHQKVSLQKNQIKKIEIKWCAKLASFLSLVLPITTMLLQDFYCYQSYINKQLASLTDGFISHCSELLKILLM